MRSTDDQPGSPGDLAEPDATVGVLGSAVHLDVARDVPLPLADRSAAAARLVRADPHLSDRAIAADTGLSAKTVATIRARRALDGGAPSARRGRDGRVRPVDPAEGRRSAGRYLMANPDATLREVARVAGISPGTARDVRDRLWRGEDPVPPRLRSDPPDRLAGSGAPTVPRPRAPEWEPGTALRVLRNDPTIRYADSGRQLLRMLDGPTAEWRELVDAVPSHCAGLVIEAVLDCIRAWHGVAEHLGKRPSTDSDDR